VLALAAFAPSFAHPDVLYKSVDANGVVMFSDMPQAGARIVEERHLPGSSSGASPGMPSSGLPSVVANAEQMLAVDPEIAHANSEVDLAERALATARRELAPLYEGVRLRPSRLSMVDDARLEPHRKNLKIARQNLAEILRDRRLALR
jgi:hypothetical protein